MMYKNGIIKIDRGETFFICISLLLIGFLFGGMIWSL